MLVVLSHHFSHTIQLGVWSCAATLPLAQGCTCPDNSKAAMEV